MAQAPVYRFAKPPKRAVNEQGVPIRQNPLPKKEKSASSVLAPQYPSESPTPEPEAPPDDESGEGHYAGTYQPVAEPERPFGDLQEATFPLDEIHGHAARLLDPAEGAGENAPLHFAESMQDSYPSTPNAKRAHQIISLAGQVHGMNNSMRVRQDQPKQTNIPVGHVRIAPLIPGSGHHVAQVHYPEGTVTTYRARLNDEDTGYR